MAKKTKMANRQMQAWIDAGIRDHLTGDDAEKVLEMYRSLTAQAPRELTCVAGLRLAPPAPWLAKEVHGKPIVALFVCYSGPLADGEKVVAPIKAFRKPVGDVVQKRSYVSQQALLDATQPKVRRYYWKVEGCYL